MPAAASFALYWEPGRIRVNAVGILVKTFVEVVVNVLVELGEVRELIVALDFCSSGNHVNYVNAAGRHPRTDLLTGQPHRPRTGWPMVVIQA